MDQSSPSSIKTAPANRAQRSGANYSNLSAVEIGARRGIGPLSSLGQRVWHGETRPCVSCGQLVRRTSGQCDQCGQLLTGDMIQKMRLCSGPWYVLEHVRPFPGVSKDRLIKQVRRGVLTPTTIVRGPSTHHQWRYAGETPGLSKYLGLCWSCQAAVHENDTVCSTCRKNLDSDGEEALIEGDETLVSESAELRRLKAAVGAAGARQEPEDDAPLRIGPLRASWIITALVLLIMVAVYWISSLRESSFEAPAVKKPPPVQRLAPDWSPKPETTSAPNQAADGGPAAESPAGDAKPRQDEEAQLMFHQPHDIGEALELRNRLSADATVINGGTDILVAMNKGTLRPRHFLDLSHVKEFGRMERDNGALVIGAGATFAQLGRLDIRCLREASLSVGGPQIRNTGSIGGNLATASPAGDGCVALLALDADVEVTSAARGPRWLRVIDEWFLAYRKTALADDELITRVRIRADYETAWHKIGKRGAVNISLVCCAISRSPDNQYRVAFGCVAFRPIRVPKTEALLSASIRTPHGSGGPLCDELIEEAAQTAMGEVSPIDDHRSSAAYRRAMCGVLVRRLLKGMIEPPKGAKQGSRGRKPPETQRLDHGALEGRHNSHDDP